jgi:methylase of polypeptide subunit release factors
VPSRDGKGKAVNYSTISLGGVDVCYSEDLDGGGFLFGQDYVRLVKEELGHCNRAFEWCAGPGFIGFSLLGHGLVHTLCLADVNPAAIAACSETIRRNSLEGRVDVYLSDCLAAIPAEERWDLVVGNPPHSGTAEVIPEFNRPLPIYQDDGWKIHQRFYGDVGAFLAPGAQVVIQENRQFSSADTFRDMLDRNGLELVGSRPVEGGPANDSYFYVWSTPRHSGQ